MIFMKKVLFITSFILSSILANAQWYISGSFSYETASEKNDKYSYTGLAISPQAGYYVNKKMDIGLSLEFSTSSDTRTLTYTNYEEITREQIQRGKTTAWTIAPYLRYSVFQRGVFEILGRASLYLGFSTNSSSIDGYLEWESTGDNMGIGLYIGPTIQYNISDKISLFTSLNFFHIRMTFLSSESSMIEPDSYTDFGLNLNFLNMGNLGVGVIYNF
jgi:hypothetical protein